MTPAFIQKILTLALILMGVGFMMIPPFSAAAQTRPDAGTKRVNEALQRRTDAEKKNAPILVELFTTAGCSACIVADRILFDAMVNDPNVIGLSCQIKNMEGKVSPDGSGSTDLSFQRGSDPCLFRLWTYAPQYGNQGVTLTVPAFIVNGTETVRINSNNDFKWLMGRYQYTPPNTTQRVSLSWKDPQTLTINMPDHVGMQQRNESASLWLLRFQNVVIERTKTPGGATQILRFSNVVQDITHIGKWYGHPRSFNYKVAPAPTDPQLRGGYVIVAQETMGEPVLAVGKIRDPETAPPPAP